MPERLACGINLSVTGEEKMARVKLSILDDDRFIRAEGITVCEPRLG